MSQIREVCLFSLIHSYVVIVVFPPFITRGKLKKDEDAQVLVGNDVKSGSIARWDYRSPFEKGVLFARDVMVCDALWCLSLSGRSMCWTIHFQNWE